MELRQREHKLALFLLLT